MERPVIIRECGIAMIANRKKIPSPGVLPSTPSSLPLSPPPAVLLDDRLSPHLSLALSSFPALPGECSALGVSLNIGLL